MNDLPKRPPHFDYFWNNIISIVIDRAYSEIDPNFSEVCGFVKKDENVYKVDLERIYKEKREWLKEIYLPHDEKPMLDFHKLGAVLCRSIIRNKPFAFDVKKATQFIEKKFDDVRAKQNNTQWFVDNLYVNYKVAFYVSVGISYLEVRKHFIDKDNFNSLKKLDERGTLYFYRKSEKHENFENSCILGLMKNDVLNRKFDYLTYATMLFQLEQYNYLLFDIKK